MKTKVARWGNSLALRLPKSLSSELGLLEDSVVEFEINQGKLIVKPASEEPTLAELVAGITPENRHPETNWGPSVGLEFG